jgi:hypothetical protein
MNIKLTKRQLPTAISLLTEARAHLWNGLEPKLQPKGSKSVGICNAIVRAQLLKTGVRNAADVSLLLRRSIDRSLSGFALYDQWVYQHHHHLYLKAERTGDKWPLIQAGRLAWLNWMIEQLEARK